jgi:hypothetical protein
MRYKSIRIVHSKYANSNIYCPANIPVIFIYFKQVYIMMKALLKSCPRYTASPHQSYTSALRAGTSIPEDSSSNTDRFLYQT